MDVFTAFNRPLTPGQSVKWKSVGRADFNPQSMMFYEVIYAPHALGRDMPLSDKLSV
jgi:hypothetical protein